MSCQKIHSVTWAVMLLIVSLERDAAWPQENRNEPLDRTWQHGPVELTLHASDRTPLVSDELLVQIRAQVQAGSEVQLPKLEGLPKEILVSGVRRVGPSSQPEGKEVWELDFKLEVLRPGPIEIPSLEVRYRSLDQSEWSTANTEPVEIEFRSVLGDDAEAATARPNPGPAAWPVSWRPYILTSITCLTMALLALAGWLVWYNRPRRAKMPSPISPYRKAMQALMAVEAAGYLERAEVDRFYTELSGIIRHYIEDRF